MKQRTMKRFAYMGTMIILAFMLAGCGNKGKSYYNQAVKNHNKGNLEEAAKEYKKAIELKDDKAEYYLDYGFCLVELNDYDQAEEMFQRAIIDKDNAIANKNSKRAYRGLGIMYYMNGDYESASKMFTKAMEYDSLKEYDVDIVSYMGSTELKLGNYEAAVEEFTQVIDQDKKNLSARLGRAEAYLMMGKNEESIADYQEAKKMDKKNQNIYLQLYRAYQAAGDLAKADQILEEATNLKVVDEEDKYYLAVVHYYQGNLDQAKAGFEAAAEQGISQSYYYLGEISLQEKDYAAALSYFEAYEADGAADGSFYNKLAVCYLKQNAYEKGLKAVDKGLKYADSTNKQELLRNEIAAYEHLGDFQTAYDKMQSYCSAYPMDQEAARDLVFLQTRQSDSEKSDEESKHSETIKKP